MADAPRPTLPPLRSLDLPHTHAQLPPIHHAVYDHACRTPRSHTSKPREPTASSSRPSCLRPCTNVSASTAPFPMRKIRLVRTSFENADAVLLVLPPPSPDTPPPQPLLLVGPALRRRRHLAKGTRVHPYRVVRDPSDRRPPSGPADTKA